jgi:hypothetical protein
VEVLVVTSGPFHDPAVRWSAKPTADGFCLTIGSDKDRMCIVLTPDEMQQCVGQYAASQWADRMRRAPQEEPHA